jgi:hypothetical protein
LLQAPSGTATVLDSGTTATPVLTFVTETGQYCREVALHARGGASRTLACRDDGEWRLRLVEFLPASTDGYATASAADSPVTAAVRRLMRGAPLDAAEEAALMARWQR